MNGFNDSFWRAENTLLEASLIFPFCQKEVDTNFCLKLLRVGMGTKRTWQRKDEALMVFMCSPLSYCYHPFLQVLNLKSATLVFLIKHALNSPILVLLSLQWSRKTYQTRKLMSSRIYLQHLTKVVHAKYTKNASFPLFFCKLQKA